MPQSTPCREQKNETEIKPCLSLPPALNIRRIDKVLSCELLRVQYRGRTGRTCGIIAQLVSLALAAAQPTACSGSNPTFMAGYNTDFQRSTTNKPTKTTPPFEGGGEYFSWIRLLPVVIPRSNTLPPLPKLLPPSPTHI